MEDQLQWGAHLGLELIHAFTTLAVADKSSDRYAGVHTTKSPLCTTVPDTWP